MTPTANPTAYTSVQHSYNEHRGGYDMKKDSSIRLSKEEQKALENTIKIGIYKAMKEKELITDFQYAQLVTAVKKL